MSETAADWWQQVADLAVAATDGAARHVAGLASRLGADTLAAGMGGGAGRWLVVAAALAVVLAVAVALGRVRMRLRGASDDRFAMEVARKWDDIGFVSVTQGELSHRRHRAASLLLAIVIGFFVVAFVWADWAVLDEVTTGSGKVIPSSQLQVIQNLEGGIIKDILVKEGQIVEKDQILIRIDDTGFAATYGEARARRSALEIAIARLTAEIEGRPLAFPPALVESRPDLVQAERTLFRLRKAEILSQVDILRQQVSQRRQELVELESRLRQLQRSFDLANEELELTRPLIKEGAISRVEVLRLEREVNDLSGDLEGTRLHIPRARSALVESQRRIQEKYDTFRADAQRELGDRYAALAVIEETSAAAKDRVTRTEVRSPMRGTVKQIKIATIGGVVMPGMDLVEIVPLEDSLLVEARVRPTDIAFIRPGQGATVKITAYDYSIYGGLPADVEHISADTITDERGEAFYLIRVRTERSYLGTEKKPLPIIPGMTATVDILTGHKTVLDYLLKPILKARNQALRER